MLMDESLKSSIEIGLNQIDLDIWIFYIVIKIKEAN